MRTIIKLGKTWLFVLAVFCLVGFSGSHGISATVEVQVTDFQFIPSTVTIAAGDTVNWVWLNGGHSVTSGTGCIPDGMWNSGIRGGGFAFPLVFDTPGAFPYYCIPHCGVGMVGTVVVTDAAPPFEGTGIQITGLSSDIMDNVIAGDSVTFTVGTTTAMGVGMPNFRFWTRKGYESIADPANPWGGNMWTLRSDWSPVNSVSITFDEPGFYFMAVHISEDTTWSPAQGGSQTGMVVEVWPVN